MPFQKMGHRETISGFKLGLIVTGLGVVAGDLFVAGAVGVTMVCKAFTNRRHAVLLGGEYPHTKKYSAPI
jgi:hypothetical protein